jgi:hypothetical protein
MRKSLATSILVLSVLLLGVRPACGQSFNIDISSLAGVPAPSYPGAAGQPGVWNALDSSSATLVDLQGNPTTAWLDVCCSPGAFGGGSGTTGAITGPDAELWNDAKLSGTPQGDWYTLYGVQDGIYEIYAYARDLLDPSQVNEIGGQNSYTPFATCSGPWPGMHVEGVTYVKHRVAAVNNSVGVFFPHLTSPFGYLAGLQVVRVSDAGTNYCVSTPNSLGTPAVMSSEGGPSTYFVTKRFTLLAAPIPNNSVGLFFYGSGTTQQPLGNGFLCVSGGSTGIARLPASLAVGGVLRHELDFAAPPYAAAKILPGSTWNFQAWYRDPAAGGASVNLSDGMTVQFIP